jgi:hypothetical protein
MISISTDLSQAKEEIKVVAIPEGDIADLRNSSSQAFWMKSGGGILIIVLLVVFSVHCVDVQKLPDGSQDIAIRNPFSKAETSFARGFYLFNLKGLKITR